jgi:hypothetical protein
MKTKELIMNRRRSVLLVLLVFGSAVVAAQGFDLDVFARTTLGSDSQSVDSYLLPLRTGISASYDYEFKPGLSPGLKAQIGFFPLSAMLTEKIIMFDFGCRLFDGIRFGSCELEPFFGYSYSSVSANDVNYGASRFDVGLEVIFGTIGLECAYVLPGAAIDVPAFGRIANNTTVLGSSGLLRLGVSYHLRRR